MLRSVLGVNESAPPKPRPGSPPPFAANLPTMYIPARAWQQAQPSGRNPRLSLWAHRICRHPLVCQERRCNAPACLASKSAEKPLCVAKSQRHSGLLSCIHLLKKNPPRSIHKWRQEIAFVRDTGSCLIAYLDPASSCVIQLLHCDLSHCINSAPIATGNSISTLMVYKRSAGLLRVARCKLR